MSAVIFAGPSLPPQLRPTDPSLRWLPPAGQGDLYRAALTRPAAIGLVDGYFEVVPTVWHKEILWAMAQGIHVFGSASIGALRAAELAPFEMKGIGRVYEDFRDGILEDDDEVAVLHGPEALGYPAVTEAMVNIRATLDAALAEAVITPPLAAILTGIGKTLFYKERRYEAILAAASAAGQPAKILDDFARWLPRGRVDRKRRDAAAMVAAIRALLAAAPPPLAVSYDLADTAAWREARQRAEPGGGMP
jgi:hypothetical protein